MTDARPADGFLDGCDIDFAAEDHVADGDVDAVVLFADVDPADPAAVAARASEWAEVLRGPSR